MNTLAQIYDTLAPEYERVRVPRFRPFVKNLLRLYDTRPGSWVLDAGCGTGLVSTLVASRAGHGGKVIGVDASAAMLEIARNKARGFGFDQCEFRQGDIQTLEFADETFDLVVCSFALWGEPDALFREFRRVLKTGGVLLMLNWPNERDAASKAFNTVLEKYRVATPDAALFAARALRETYGKSWDALREPGDYANALKAVGYAEAHGGWDKATMQFANADELFAYINAGWLHFAEWSQMDAETQNSFRADVVQALQTFGDGKISIEKRALQIAARK